MNSDMQLGKLAEMKFSVNCIARGFTVSVPHSDFTGYDLIIESKSKKLYKVQVKATRTKERDNRTNCYKVCVSRGTSNKKRYDKNEVDLFAVYIKETDNWFIIPFNACTSTNIRLYPHKPDHKFTSYLEAWWQFK
jgi:hypothetical protein